jgi:DNA-binding CsgD family transcriptional regulator
MPPHAIDVREAGAFDLLLDSRTMAIWELLRRVRTPCTVAELATWASCPAQVAQATMDRLGHFGLVESVQAGGRRRAVSYRVTQERIVLAGTPRDPNDRALLKRFYEDCQEANDRMFGSGAAFELSWHPEELFEFLCAPVNLNPLEVLELRRRLGEVLQFLKLVQSKHNGVRMRPPPKCNYYVTLRVQPLARPVLAQPDITVAPRGQIPPPVVPEPAREWPALSAREREIAIALVSGSTLPEIARTLGRSPHTVSTLTRRIYRKLGVRRRAELVNRLRVMEPPPVG